MDHAAAAEHAAQGAALSNIAFVAAIAGLLGLGLIILRQPPLVGFILAGMALGPTGFGVIPSSAYVNVLAEMGVLVLLFFIGIELSLKAFVLTLKQAVLVCGGQITAAVSVGLLIGYVLGLSIAEGVILGFIIALSSTVVAMKMLDEMGVLRGEEGRVAIAVLIAQDLAVVPMLVFASSFGGESVNYTVVTLKIVVSVGLLGGLLWWLGSRGKLRVPYTEKIERNVEIVAVGALAICFTAASLSGLAGLSPVYGAFLAGILIGNSTLRSRVIPVIEPIQSVLLVIFFLSIGLLIDLWFIWDNLLIVMLVCLVVIAAKSVLNIALLRLTGSDPRTALVAGLSMAQIGEFSFVLAAAGMSAHILHDDTYRLAIAVTAISLLVSPVWAGLMHRIEDLAASHIISYRVALREAYAREIEEMQRGRMVIDVAIFHTRLRYRAVRLAVYHRRAARQEAAAKTDSDPEIDEAAEPQKTDEKVD
ncbi:cation:proton antiporter [Hoeflea sp. WL0058]|uniref:Cation:proton antiporter n=1 Tax=Flavimaribacter sediminis TaxID=2865987 RepID=A0AAE3CZC6_9HYPH|nr:cation:proton antiporter [Flavimaribacter sediminis]MBW8635738.1 cation:proton antiporter [Flavimaribacter sediminis]